MLAIFGLIAAGRFLIRPLFRLIGGLGEREMFVMAALLTVIASAAVMELLGLSLALGAFIAGVMLADTPYRHELEADVEPLRGLLLGLFFLAVGMMLDLHAIAERPFEVLGFAVLLAVVAGLGFGLAPAWSGSRVDLLETLKEGGHQSSPAGHRWRQGLVALEVALALVLAVNTGLLVKSIYQLYTTELGYRTSDVLTANLALPRRYGTPVQQRDFANRWLEGLASLPGVKAASLTDAPPLSPYQQVVFSSTTQGSSAANASASSAPRSMAVAGVTPDFFRAAGIALRQGRFFTAQDGADAPIVAIVNESFVKQYYPEGITLGAQITGPVNPGGGHGGTPPTAAVVGVAFDADRTIADLLGEFVERLLAVVGERVLAGREQHLAGDADRQEPPQQRPRGTKGRVALAGNVQPVGAAVADARRAVGLPLRHLDRLADVQVGVAVRFHRRRAR